MLLGLVACAKGQTAPDAGASDTAVVSISPATPHGGDDLHAVVSSPSMEGYGFRWSVDGGVRADLTGLDVPGAQTHRDQKWSVDLLGAGGAVVSTASVTILDTAPGQPTIAPTVMPCAGEAIQCVVTQPAPDKDGDAITYTATWTHNGQPFTGAVQTVFPGDTVPASANPTIGDAWICTVTASDGELMGPAVASAATTTVDGGPKTFAFTGGPQTYTVPDCVKHLTIAVWGAQGGNAKGGNGGYAQGNLDVSAGMVLDVEVGGQNGYNGGGAGIGSAGANGGGASDVRVGGTDVVNRVIVAGGGGGGGNGDAQYAGGTGGGGTCGATFCGGGGGQGYGGPGGAGGEAGGGGVNAPHAGGGGGGGHSSGGGGSCESYDAPARCGTGGNLGVGGNGEPTSQQLHSGVCYSTWGGTAGGGGGYYGGGGTATGYCGSGAGGGGSSWVGTLTATTMTAGVRAGNGQVVLTPY
jgi:hypothetical protein